MYLDKNEVLVIKSINRDGTSHWTNTFKYLLEIGSVTTEPNWSNKPCCGDGLHGLLWGVGYGGYLHTKDSLYLVFKVKNTKNNLVDCVDKVKFKSGTLVFVSDSVYEATEFISKYAPENTPINYRKQITTEDKVIQFAGYCSTQTAVDCSTQTAGNWSTQTAGNCSTQTAGNCSTQTAVDCSTQTAVDWSTQTAVDCSTQTAGSWSTQTAGVGAVQTAGVGTVQVGRWQCGGEYKTVTRIITEKEANKPYRFKDGEWFPVSDS